MTQTGSPVIELQAVCKRYDLHSPEAVDHISLVVWPGEILALLGPSGCGKTTTLRLIAGFERPDCGEVRIKSQVVASESVWVPPEARGVGTVFQDYALFPHLTVARNVAFGLLKLDRASRARRVAEVLELVELSDLAQRYPHELSGGQQQRTALARALAPRPVVVLLDEPFNSLDANLRASTRAEVQRLLKATNTTAVFVTHDQDEAMTLADRVAVVRDGRIEQAGPPEEVYHRPSTHFVASFLGRANLLVGTVRRGVAQTIAGAVPVDAPDGEVLLCIRPEDLYFSAGGTCQATVVQRVYHGHDVVYHLRAGDAELLVQTTPHCPVRVGDQVRIAVSGQAVAIS